MRLQDFENEIATAETTADALGRAAGVFQGHRRPARGLPAPSAARRPGQPPACASRGFPDGARGAVHGRAAVPSTIRSLQRRSGRSSRSTGTKSTTMMTLARASAPFVDEFRAIGPRAWGRHSGLWAERTRRAVRAGVPGGGAAARCGGAERVLAGLPAGALALLRAGPADARAAAGAVASGRPRCWAGWRAARATALIGEILGISGAYGRCAPSPDLPQARGVRPDQRRGARHRDRADPRGNLRGGGAWNPYGIHWVSYGL